MASNSKTVVGIADAIATSLNGQELTKTQRDILRSEITSPTVQSVISELMQKKAGRIDIEPNHIYDREDISGLTDEEKAALWYLAYHSVGGDRSGEPGMLRENGSIPPESFSSAQRRGLTSEVDVFGDNDYATVMGGSSPYQVHQAVSEDIYENYLGSSFTWKLRGEDVTLNDVKVQEISYVNVTLPS